MRVEYFTHCGPYVECKFQKTTAAVEKRRCSNATCNGHQGSHRPERDKFCTDCGSPIETFNVEVVVDAVDSWELEQEFQGHLWQPFGDYADKLSEQGLHIWIGRNPPEANDRPAVCYPEDDEEGLSEVRPADIETELEQFNVSYGDEVERLREAYGADAVAVKWGILHRVSC